MDPFQTGSRTVPCKQNPIRSGSFRFGGTVPVLSRVLTPYRFAQLAPLTRILKDLKAKGTTEELVPEFLQLNLFGRGRTLRVRTTIFNSSPKENVGVTYLIMTSDCE